jgi:hypothetical protein
VEFELNFNQVLKRLNYCDNKHRPFQVWKPVINGLKCSNKNRHLSAILDVVHFYRFPPSGRNTIKGSRQRFLLRPLPILWGRVKHIDVHIYFSAERWFGRRSIWQPFHVRKGVERTLPFLSKQRVKSEMAPLFHCSPPLSLLRQFSDLIRFLLIRKNWRLLVCSPIVGWVIKPLIPVFQLIGRLQGPSDEDVTVKYADQLNGGKIRPLDGPLNCFDWQATSSCCTTTEARGDPLHPLTSRIFQFAALLDWKMKLAAVTTHVTWINNRRNSLLFYWIIGLCGRCKQSNSFIPDYQKSICLNFTFHRINRLTTR